MRLPSRVALCVGLGACTPQLPDTVNSSGDRTFAFQALRDCPRGSDGEPAVGRACRNAWMVDCLDGDGDGLIDLIVKTRSALAGFCMDGDSYAR